MGNDTRNNINDISIRSLPNNNFAQKDREHEEMLRRNKFEINSKTQKFMPKLLPNDQKRDKSVGGESCEISPDHSPLLRLGQAGHEIPLEVGQEISISEQSPIIQQDISQDDRSPQETTLTRVTLFENQ